MILVKNTVANFLSKGWISFILLVFTPAYVYLLGVEAYGLVGIFYALMGLSASADLGIGAAFNREIARLSVEPESRDKRPSLFLSLEWIFLLFALLIAVVTLCIVPSAGSRWLNPDSLSQSVVQKSLIYIGLALACHVPYYFYSNGLLGLQRQVLSGTILSALTTLRVVGGYFVLLLSSASPEHFFLWQMAMSVVQSLTFRALLCREIGQPFFHLYLIFDFHNLKEIRRFAWGMGGISLTGLFITQMDKIVLGKLVSLEQLGYYSLASSLCMGAQALMGGFLSAYFPHLSQLVQLKDYSAVKKVYRQGLKWVTLITLPVGIISLIFTEELLVLWTANNELAAHVAPVLRLLIIGTVLYNLYLMAFVIQLAFGWMRPTFYLNLASMILSIPLTVVLTQQFGILGGAATWVLLNISYILIGVPLTHRRLLQTQEGNVTG